MNTNGSFGDWLRQRRKALDLTQADLADQVGCSITTIRKIEADRRRPSRQISERMADVLAISAEDRTAFVNFARHVVEAKSVRVADLHTLTSTSNLPSQLTPFIGRDAELAQIADRLDDPSCRLLNLVGPGGIGKTRLALQAASEQVGAYADGVFLVSLAPVGATTLISSAIASALQVSFYGQQDPDAQIVNYLRSKHMLLVLDNYEHLLGGISLLADILANAPRVKLLVTSRERLNMQEEWVLPVHGLPFPVQDSIGAAVSYDAVDLFIQTARRIEPEFSLEGSEAAVINICRAVEGMPLGIELAATWLRAMPCNLIAGQIRRDLDFLATPLRNVAERHRSLRAVFEHSWSLLSEAEQDVMMKLSVFRGGIDAEAAEQVANASLLRLATLVDKSLVRVNPAGRYEMHELLRQFAADKLLESDLADETRNRQLRFFLELAEQLERQQFGLLQLAAFDQLEIELDNVRAALDWAAQVGDAESGLRLAGALGWFWNRRAHWHEGRERLVTFLSAGSHAPVAARAKALHHILELSCELSDREYAISLRPEALMLVREVDDLRIKAWLLSSVGFTSYTQSEWRTYYEDALALFRQIGDQRGSRETMVRLAMGLLNRGDFVPAGELIEEGIRLARQAGDKSVLAFWLCLSGSKDSFFQRKIDQRTVYKYQEALELCRELRYKNGVVWALIGLAEIAYMQGEYGQARVFYEQSLLLGQHIGSKGFIIDCLLGLAKIHCAHAEPERAARVLGATSDLIFRMWSGPSNTSEIYRRDCEDIQSAARAQLGEAAFAVAFAEGQAMTLDRAIAETLSDTTGGQVIRLLEEPLLERELELPRAFTARVNHDATWADQLLTDPLTPRELEILQYMSVGLTNQEIADTLVIGVSTVKKHVSHIYSKLGVSDRIKAVNHARALDLLPLALP
jgi:predicted ATPase/DNA-binding CsgD family transcriptional regulator/DNA-binding XRE family transcriptional regulator